jgi:hypothetical protein
MSASSSGKRWLSTSPAAPLYVAWPDTYAGKNGVSRNGFQSRASPRSRIAFSGRGDQ